MNCVQASWKDTRLIPTWHKIYRNIHGFNFSECRNVLCNDSRVTMGREFADDIWKPDFYLASATSIVPADAYNDNVCVRFDMDGTLFYSSRFIIAHSCPMSMGYFPFDQHKCLVSQYLPPPPPPHPSLPKSPKPVELEQLSGVQQMSFLKYLSTFFQNVVKMTFSKV